MNEQAESRRIPEPPLTERVAARLRDLIVQADTTQMANELMDEIPQESVMGATLVAATVPILIVYPFLQRYFVRGMLVGAIKE